MLEKDAMNILMKFLDKKVRQAEEEVTRQGILSDDKAIPLILKTQFNHIAHLEEIMDKRLEQVDRRFEQVDRRFEQVDARFSRLERNLFGGFAFLGFLMTMYRFLH
ncbi:MAG: hypothetical protein ACYCPQ_02060 [Elusimicrobiota bacterium]